MRDQLIECWAIDADGIETHDRLLRDCSWAYEYRLFEFYFYIPVDTK